MTGPNNDEDKDVALKLLHTADWHLGRRFPAFAETDQKRLMRARIDVIDTILDAAERHSVDAVVCAGDLFHDADPGPVWWQGLAGRFAARTSWPTNRPIFLLPGNHDPLIRTSVYWREHPFRDLLPPWVHIVDRSGFSYELGPDAVLYAEPCQSSAGQDRLTDKLPPRGPEDHRIRIGLVHGSTYDAAGHDNDFPIPRDAAEQRGLDYLAIGDTHSFREVPPGARIPTVYPGAPEPTNFGEDDPGNVALVFFFRRRRRPRIERLPVARWRWEEQSVNSLSELRALCARIDLQSVVMRLRVHLAVTLAEEVEVQRLLTELAGTDATRGKVGVLLVDKQLSLRTDDRSWVSEMPDILQRVAQRIEDMRVQTSGGTNGEGESSAGAAELGLSPELYDRVLTHLYRLLQSRGALTDMRPKGESGGES